MRVELAAREDRAQRDDDRGGIVVSAHLSDEPPAWLQRPVDAREHGLLVAHPVQRRAAFEKTASNSLLKVSS